MFLSRLVGPISGAISSGDVSPAYASPAGQNADGRNWNIRGRNIRRPAINGVGGWATVKPRQGHADSRVPALRPRPPRRLDAADRGPVDPESIPTKQVVHVSPLHDAPVDSDPAPPVEQVPAQATDATSAGSGNSHSDVDFFCANRASGAERDRVSRLSMTDYIATGGRFPIVIVTKDRASMLRETLTALIGGSVRCVTKADVFVVQDGSDAGVTAVLDEMGIHYEQGKGSQRPGGPPLDGAASIAGHYRFTLGRALAADGPLSVGGAPPPAIIVVEDDFRFAPDFYEYFHAVAPAIEADPTLWLASAWNDNGFDYLVADPTALRRTGYFPGLGWLLPLAVWQQELAPAWPSSHWDHWMRDPSRSRGRDIVIPEVPRDYHAGVRGTFMDAGTHNKYFGSIAMQADATFTWDTPEGARAIEGLLEPAYSARLEATLSDPETVHVTSLDALRTITSGTAVMWYACPTGENEHTSMRPVAAYFGIWHEGARGSRRGVHELWWLGSARLVLVNVWDGGDGIGHVSGGIESAVTLKRFMPKDVTPIAASAFIDVERPVLHTHEALFGAHLVSPLAHLQGGPDANGPPDVAVSVPAGDARPAPLRAPPAGAGSAHEHARFLSDLDLGSSKK